MDLAQVLKGESDPSSLPAALSAYATDTRSLFKRSPTDRFNLWRYSLLGLDFAATQPARRARLEQLKKDVIRQTSDPPGRQQAQSSTGFYEGADGDDEDEDPLLRLKDGGRWSKVFHYQHTLEQVKKDVDRLFVTASGEPEESHTEIATRILLLWAQLHESVSYKQGMHEVLRPLLDVAFESHEAELNALEPDLYFMFDALMSHLVSLYQDGAAQQSGQSLRETCEDIRERLLLRAAPDLKNQLDRLGIDLRLFALRWLRCLFTREFDTQTRYLYGFWDALLSQAFLGMDAQYSLVELASFFSVAMIMRVRETIMAAQVNHEALGCLMHFPPLQSDAEALQLVMQSLQLKVLGDKPMRRTPLEEAQERQARLGFRLKGVLGALEKEVLKGKEHMNEGKALELIAQAKQIQDVLLRRLGEEECFWEG